MRGIDYEQKKSIIGPVISVFVMVLVISILAGLTFLFVSELKTNVEDTTATTTATVTNEAGWVNETGYTLATIGELGFRSPSITSIINESSGDAISDYTFDTSTFTITNSTAYTEGAVNVSYTYKYIGEDTAYNSVNKTEAAGATVVNYLSLIFLAVIFGAILTLVLRIILPYINLGKQFDGF